MRLVCGLPLVALLWGCNAGPSDHLVEARSQLAETAYEDAVEAADAGLSAASGDSPTSWGLKMVKLEALARAGRSEETKELLTRIVSRYPERIPTSQYAATADQLDKAGEGPAAIEVLDMGMQQYPGDPLISKLIGAQQQADDVDAAELEMLRTLGYIE